MSREFHEIQRDARAELRDRLDEIDGDEPHDVIHEIADGSVPIYYSDIFRVLADLDSYELDDPGLAEGVTDISKIAQIRIYEAISSELWDEWRAIEDERED